MKNKLIRLLAAVLLLMLAVPSVWAEGTPEYNYQWKGKQVASYQSDTLKFTMETTLINECKCYITKVWVQDPARQIRKATSTWKTDLLLP